MLADPEDGIEFVAAVLVPRLSSNGGWAFRAMMDDDLSITLWIARLKGGEDRAARVIWDRFFDGVCALARKRLRDSPQRVADEEDVALSSINALCQGAREGRFRQLETREDLWQLLALIACRKISNLRRSQRSRKEVGESAIAGPHAEFLSALDGIVEGPADSRFLDTLADTSDELLARLEPKLQGVAILKLEGYTNAEIAERHDKSVKTIERYLKMIRHYWTAG